MKIKTITVSNLKAVSAMTADFNGCTAIITGGNNKGKTSFLKGLFDRVRGTKIATPVKEGEKEGFAETTLTSGERLRWEFSDAGKEKLLYFTEKNIKTSLTKELREKFLPDVFDVDKFLQDQPAKQRKTLQDLVGLDFTDIDKRYETTYSDREDKNRRAKEWKIRFEAASVVPNVSPVDVTEIQGRKDVEGKRLNDLYTKNKNSNDNLRSQYNTAMANYNRDVQVWNNEQNLKDHRLGECQTAYELLMSYGYDGQEVKQFVFDLPRPMEAKDCPIIEPAPSVLVVELPDNTTLTAIDNEILAAIETNNNAARYKAYVELKEQAEQYSKDASEAQIVLTGIETERMDLIKSAKMPEGFSFSNDGILYNGLAFTREQLSSSGIYIAALKLAEMQLGEVRTLYFDASYLDKNSLSDIEKWAESMDLHLLVERPCFEGGEITYELLASDSQAYN